ncbi:MAG: signal peptidase II [Spirochaetales bacterium]|jgi:signal peptidase II|nr:signal peptidase II [Spirochaetales bacterium]
MAKKKVLRGEKDSLVRKAIPFSLSFGVILLDQFTKWLVVLSIPHGRIGAQFFGDFLRFIFVNNPGIAFSMGKDMPDALREVFFTALPLFVLAVLVAYYFRSDEFSRLQRWAIAGIVGGGCGNLIDRIFRPEGVVDFIDVKFFGLLGMERWPTFNVADSSVVVCGLLLAFSLFFGGRHRGTSRTAASGHDSRGTGPEAEGAGGADGSAGSQGSHE